MRHSTRALWLRLLVGTGRLIGIVIVQAAVLWLVARILPGITLVGLRAPGAVSLAMLISMLIIWPLFIHFFFKLVIWTAGLVTVLVNGFIVVVVGWISPNLVVANFGWAVLYSFIVTIILTLRGRSREKGGEPA